VSPFGDRGKIHTSWAEVETRREPEPVKRPSLQARDIRTEVFRAGGHGGQGVNTTDSAVRLVHLPTGQRAVCQATRSQVQNKLRAWAILEERVRAALTPSVDPRRTNQAPTRRHYILDGHPRVTDGRMGKTNLLPEAVLGGDLDPLLECALEHASPCGM
jgi:peptide chain release factor 2